MKVIEHVRNNRTGEVTEVSWGNNITSDLSVISSVANIIDNNRDRKRIPVLEYLTTVAITIEL